MMVRLDVEPAPEREHQVLDQDEQVEANARNLFDYGIQDTRVTDATLHVFSRSLTGENKLVVKNTGFAPLLRSDLEDWNVNWDNIDIVDGSAFIGLLLRDATFTVTASWTLTGILSVLWELLNLLFTGTIKVEHRVKVTALGFKKTLIGTVILPVDDVSVEWN